MHQDKIGQVTSGPARKHRRWSTCRPRVAQLWFHTTNSTSVYTALHLSPLQFSAFGWCDERNACDQDQVEDHVCIAPLLHLGPCWWLIKRQMNPNWTYRHPPISERHLRGPQGKIPRSAMGCCLSVEFEDCLVFEPCSKCSNTAKRQLKSTLSVFSADSPHITTWPLITLLLHFTSLHPLELHSWIIRGYCWHYLALARLGAPPHLRNSSFDKTPSETNSPVGAQRRIASQLQRTHMIRALGHMGSQGLLQRWVSAGRSCWTCLSCSAVEMHQSNPAGQWRARRGKVPRRYRANLVCHCACKSCARKNAAQVNGNKFFTSTIRFHWDVSTHFYARNISLLLGRGMVSKLT